jgi:hypothetical protein
MPVTSKKNTEGIVLIHATGKDRLIDDDPTSKLLERLAVCCIYQLRRVLSNFNLIYYISLVKKKVINKATICQLIFLLVRETNVQNHFSIHNQRM